MNRKYIRTSIIILVAWAIVLGVIIVTIAMIMDTEPADTPAPTPEATEAVADESEAPRGQEGVKVVRLNKGYTANAITCLQVTATPDATPPTPAATEPMPSGGEALPGAESTETATPPQECHSDNVPISYDLQDVMRTACEEYACPYSLALAVAEVESRFDPDAVGAAGEVGIMQLNPGPNGSYHAELEAATGSDPATPAGNIICGVYMLGKYIGRYGDLAKAVMAYNMGEGGAKTAWASGVASTAYSNEVLDAMEGWKTIMDTP